jgi:hypothetical protein
MLTGNSIIKQKSISQSYGNSCLADDLQKVTNELKEKKCRVYKLPIGPVFNKVAALYIGFENVILLKKDFDDSIKDLLAQNKSSTIQPFIEFFLNEKATPTPTEI